MMYESVKWDVLIEIVEANNSKLFYLINLVTDFFCGTMHSAMTI